jgi:uncharacterized protein YuzE
MMRVRVDRRAIYFDLTGRPIEASEATADGVIVDYDSQGRVVGVEVLNPHPPALNPRTPTA